MMRKIISVLVTIVASFTGAAVQAEQFLTQSEFEKSRSIQVTTSPRTLQQLYSHGVSEHTELKLEYFFFINQEAKAASLNEALVNLGYQGSYGRAVNDYKLFVITGWTPPMKMEVSTVTTWTESMCDLGFEFDTEFDGWGTNPSQYSRSLSFPSKLNNIKPAI